MGCITPHCNWVALRAVNWAVNWAVNGLHYAPLGITPRCKTPHCATNLDHGKNLIEIEKEVNTELLYIVEWLQTNLLSLNVSKTSHIIFTRKQNQVANIFVGNTKIEQQFDAKFLGVIISSDLGWSKHIDVIVVRSKSAKNVGIIAKGSSYPSRNSYSCLIFGSR